MLGMNSEYTRTQIHSEENFWASFCSYLIILRVMWLVLTHFCSSSYLCAAWCVHFVQFQKHHFNIEATRLKLVEAANYVDKVRLGVHEMGKPKHRSWIMRIVTEEFCLTVGENNASAVFPSGAIFLHCFPQWPGEWRASAKQFCCWTPGMGWGNLHSLPWSHHKHLCFNTSLLTMLPK